MPALSIKLEFTFCSGLEIQHGVNLRKRYPTDLNLSRSYVTEDEVMVLLKKAEIGRAHV